MYNHDLKLGRALQHLHSLDAKIRMWGVEDYAYRFVPKLDDQSGKKIVRVEILRPPPAEFGLIIGDCLHNLHSALDNLVYDLTVAYTETDPLPEECARDVAFPIFGDKPLKPRKCREMIGGIDPDAQTIIKDLQPHNRGDKYASDALWKLYKLSNVDKHRLLHLTVFTTDSFAHFPDAPERPRDLELWVHSSMENGAKIAQYTPPPTETDTEVNMHVNFAFGVAFGQRSAAPGWRVVPTLRWLHSYIIREISEPLR